MATDEHLERNNWGWGKVRVGTGYEWYHRVSKIASVYTDMYAIEQWRNRLTLKGAANNPFITEQARQTDDYNELNALCAQAFDEAGGNEAARKGSEIHAIVEKLDAGEAVDIPLEYRPIVAGYSRAVEAHELRAYMTEQLIVNDDLKVVGSFDKAWALPDGRIVIGDLKTGSRVHPHAVAMQIAMYANGVLYDPVTEERTPMPEVSTDIGLVIHAPLKGGVKVLELELEEAYRWVTLAVESRAWHKTKVSSDWSK